MDAFLNFFETMPTWQKAAWVGICISLNLIFEGFIPLRKFDYKKVKHAAVNLFFLVPVFIINFIFGLLTVWIYMVIGTDFGLLNLFALPVWVELIITILLFDLIGQYGVHYYLHKFKWLWKMHMTHHSDTHVDVTSATRLHPGDYLLREVCALGVIVITGAPIAFYMVYRITTIFFTYFTHANINLPLWLDKTICLVFVTPNMHKFHHHFERPWTDTNFGNMFSIWDRIFGTFVYDDPAKIRYGLDVLDDSTDEDISFQLGLPFNKNVKTDY